jgi:CubicO group peptidase (beta-lactamase class C family)
LSKSPPTKDQADEVLQRICAERKIPGAAIGIVSDGEVIVESAYGIANLETGLRATNDTIFQAGSIGKSYTATVVMHLADEGKLDLDKPVSSYVTDLELSDSHAAATVTPRQLLSHTSGIDGDSIDERGIYGRGDDCLERYTRDLKNLPMIFEPGEFWSYCNSGYILLGRLIEVVTETTYEAAVKERLLEPLGLKKTAFFPGEIIMHSVAAGHLPQPDGDPIVAPVWEFSRASHPAGGNISTTVGELLAFGQLHLNKGAGPDGKQIVSEDSVREMQRPHVSCPERELLGDQWGLGWFLRTEASPSALGHDGNTFGLTSCLRLVPERNTAYAFLANLAGQNYAFTDFAKQLIDPWLRTKTLSKPTAKKSQDLGDPDRFTGVYEKIGARIHVTFEDHRLNARLEQLGEQGGQDGQGPRPLQAVDETRFLMHLAEIGEDLAISFVHEDSEQKPRYLEMGARLFRRHD